MLPNQTNHLNMSAIAKRKSVEPKAGHGIDTVHNREGQLISRGAKGIAQKTLVPAGIAYDAEDIEEANRIGAALCRQHAR